MPLRHKNPKTLSGIETHEVEAGDRTEEEVRHKNPKTLSGIETGFQNQGIA